MTKVGFIGLGTMGRHFGTHLQEAGYDLTVHDVSRQIAEKHLAAGATWAETPKALAEASDIVMTSLPGPPEVESVVLDPENGLVAGLKPRFLLEGEDADPVRLPPPVVVHVERDGAEPDGRGRRAADLGLEQRVVGRARDVSADLRERVVGRRP